MATGVPYEYAYIDLTEGHGWFLVALRPWGGA